MSLDTTTIHHALHPKPYIEIVRELAERGPFIDDDQNGYGSQYCADCHVEASRQGPNDPANHKPSCLWRRARELHPA